MLKKIIFFYLGLMVLYPMQAGLYERYIQGAILNKKNNVESDNIKKILTIKKVRAERILPKWVPFIKKHPVISVLTLIGFFRIFQKRPITTAFVAIGCLIFAPDKMLSPK